MSGDVRKLKETTTYWACNNKKCIDNDGSLHFHLKNKDKACLYDGMGRFQLEIYEYEKGEAMIEDVK